MTVSIIPEGELVCGLQLPVQSQSTIYVEPWEADAGAAELARVVAKAEDVGLFYLAVCDHVAVPREQAARMSTTWYDTVATLAWVGALTERVRLLSHVLVAGYRPPLVTAKSFLTIDELTGGRAVLGIGVGHVEGEFEALGADFAGRGAVTDEVIDVVRAAFADEFPVHHGDRFDIEDVGLRPRGAQDQIPIWVGGSSRPARRRAAERGDGWLPQGPPPEGMEAAIAHLRELRAACGRGDDPMDIGGFAMPMYIGEPGWETGPWTTTGPGEQHAAGLRELAAVGVNHVQVRLRSRSVDELCDQLDAFGAEVLPLVND
jgi:probable F420-dependent oxidoreductase